MIKRIHVLVLPLYLLYLLLHRLKRPHHDLPFNFKTVKPSSFTSPNTMVTCASCLGRTNLEELNYIFQYSPIGASASSLIYCITCVFLSLEIALIMVNKMTLFMLFAIPKARTIAMKFSTVLENEITSQPFSRRICSHLLDFDCVYPEYGT